MCVCVCVYCLNSQIFIYAARRRVRIFLSRIRRAVVTAVAQWLRYCVTNRKVGGSIPDGVTGIFH